ncbi:MAG: hemolysin family protein [Gemmatimonadetes bacterium]|nr:hemolysin family protein [Gemmatimonadota bacterium]
MILLPLLVAAGALACAALLAVADGALLAEALPPLPGQEPADPGRTARVERAHRSLAAARVVAQVTLGGALGWVVAPSGDLTPGGATRGALLIVAAVTVSESLARLLGGAFGARAAVRLDPVVRVAEVAMAPVVRLGAWLDARLAVVLAEPESSLERREVAAAQFRDVVTSEADVSRDERELLLGVFDFGETTVEEVMVPRVDIVGIDRCAPWSELLDRVRSAQHARLPVYEDTVDEVVGVLVVKDLLPAVLAGDEPEAGWPSLLRTPLFIPATKRIADLLREFRATGRHLAIVADEYGGTAGLVTIEDILEELVGEIRDEYDDEERLVEREGDARYWVSGRLTLDDLSEAVGHDFRRDDVTTVGGLILDVLGRVPRAGEALALGPFRVRVERVVRRKIQRVFLERTAPEHRDAGEEEDA